MKVGLQWMYNLETYMYFKWKYMTVKEIAYMIYMYNITNIA